MGKLIHTIQVGRRLMGRRRVLGYFGEEEGTLVIGTETQ